MSDVPAVFFPNPLTPFRKVIVRCLPDGTVELRMGDLRPSDTVWRGTPEEAARIARALAHGIHATGPDRGKGE